MINLNSIMFIYANTTFDAELAELEPPAFASIDENTPEDVIQMLKTAGSSAAKRYDKYKEVRHISTLFAGRCQHIVITGENCFTFNAAPGRPNAVGVVQTATEAELVAYFWDNLIELGFDGPTVIAGWNLSSFWPTLVTKAIKYGVKLPAVFCQDPTRRYMSSDRLIDLASIYLQGHSPAVRFIPDLRDMLDYCVNSTDIAYPAPKEIVSARADQWVTPDLPVRVEAYLTGMQQLLAKYTGSFQDVTVQSMYGQVTTDRRGPQPADNI